MSLTDTQKGELAASYGLVNTQLAIEAARASGLYFYAACALLEKESRGRNVYGHDVGGVLSGFPHEVNVHNFRAFIYEVERGGVSNGVGPCQITYPGYFTQMAESGLQPWDVYDNMLFGFGLLWKNYLANGRDWAKAGTLYNAGNLRNGINAYGFDLAAKVTIWQERFRTEKFNG